MRHRKTAGGSKIKMEHGMIRGLRKLLEKIEQWPEISSIIPGPIKPTKRGQGVLSLEIKYPTLTGLKCLAYSGGAVQEVFIVTGQPDLVSARLSQL